MTLISRFYDNTLGNRKYNALPFNEYLANLVTEGVVNESSTSMLVQTSSGMTVRIRPGNAILNKVFANINSDYSVTLDTAPTSGTRVDRIVLRWSALNRRVTVNILKGGPSVQNITRTPLIYEIALARINVGANVTSITSSMIIDERSNDSLCGFVETNFLQITDIELRQQLQYAFNNFMNNVNTELQLDNATNLTEQVIDLQNNKIDKNYFASASQNGVLKKEDYAIFDKMESDSLLLSPYAPDIIVSAKELTLETHIRPYSEALRPFARKVGKFVEIGGTVTGPNGGFSPLFTLPEIYRPKRTIYIVGLTNSVGGSSKHARYQLNTAGVLTLEATATGEFPEGNYYTFRSIYNVEDVVYS